MGAVLKHVRIKTTEEKYYVSLEFCEERGYEVEYGISDEDGDYEGLGCWSFGDEFWSSDVGHKWHNYLYKAITDIKEKRHLLDELINKLNLLDCAFDLEDDEHLKDLNVILNLVK